MNRQSWPRQRPLAHDLREDVLSSAKLIFDLGACLVLSWKQICDGHYSAIIL